MLKLGKLFAAHALIVSLSVPQLVMAQSADPLDDGVATCGVPVCSAMATVEVLKTLNENQRYNYTNKLVTAYKDSKDIKVLENLLSIAKEIKALTTSMGDADWVIREASTLANNSIFNLAKFSEPNAKNMLSLFAQLDNATKRYEVISHFQTELVNIEDTAVLNELVAFAIGAQKYTIQIGDESWIPRAASTLASDITVKLNALDPVHEGVYTVAVVQGDNKVLAFDKVVVLDSSSEENLVVNFMNSKLNTIVFSYSHATLVGNTISGKLISNGSLSSAFEMNFNRSTGALKGTITTTRSKQIVFKGNQNFSARTIFAGKVPYSLTENSIIGDMKGEILGIKGTLSIQSFLPNVYSASFVADNGLVVIDFKGKFFAKNGVLALTHANKVKLTLSLRQTANGVLWKGASYSSTNGKVIEASFIPAAL